MVLIGASTGGPGHLKKILKDIELNNSCIIVAQHMNSFFIPSFAMQLDKECRAQVEILNQRTILQSKIYICNQNFIINKSYPLSANPDEMESTFNPNINILFSSASKINFEIKIMAILLTGIGDDGAKGLLDLYQKGAQVIAENEESAIVYGMPKKAKELNPHIKSINLNMIKQELKVFLYE